MNSKHWKYYPTALMYVSTDPVRLILGCGYISEVDLYHRQMKDESARMLQQRKKEDLKKPMDCKDFIMGYY